MDNEKPKVPELHELFARTCVNLKKFVYFRLVLHYLIVPLIIFLSYFQEEFQALPYLHLEGPKDAGKTTVLIIIGLSGYNPLNATHTTDAVISRMIHQQKGILMMDDAEIFGTPHPRSLSLSHRVFLSGYKKSGGSVWVCDRRDPYGYIEYNVYCVKVTANKEGIYDQALRSRYIIIPMSEPSTEQRLQIFFPDSDGNVFSTIGADLLLLSKDESLRNEIKAAYLGLREDERVKDFRGRAFEIMAPLFALAKVIEKSAGREFLFEHILDFAENYIDAKNRDGFHTDPDTMAIYLVWKYVKELSGKEGFAENKYFFAQKLWDDVKTNLIEYFGKLDFQFTLRRLGKILETHGFLIWPEKGKVMRVRQEEDPAKAPDPAWHYHIDVDALKKFAEKSFKEYEDPDVDKPADVEHL